MPPHMTQTRTGLRPQLSEVQSALFSYENVLRYTGPAGVEYSDPWDPTSQSVRRESNSTKPDYCVGFSIDTEASGQFRSIQAAINQAILDRQRAQSSALVVINIAPGIYEGLVYIPRLIINQRNVAFSLCGQSRNPEHTQITANIDAEMTGTEYQQKFAEAFDSAPPEVEKVFRKIAACSTITTANASVVRIENDECFASNLTVKNTYNADRLEVGGLNHSQASRSDFQLSTGQHQAVALMVSGADKVHCENLHLKSYQDTLYLQSSSTFSGTRCYFNRCTIEGDVDFIFGQSIAYFSQCKIKSIGSRTPHSWVTAASTNIRSRYGFVFNDCDFVHDDSPNALIGTFSLGRQWFEGVRATPYGLSPVVGYECIVAEKSRYAEPFGSISLATLSAVGKCVIMNSRIGTHINPAAPWDDWNGGCYSRDGTYRAGSWHPRFRPAQYVAGCLSTHLAQWLNTQGIDFSDIDSSDVLLGEFENESEDLKPHPKPNN